MFVVNWSNMSDVYNADWDSIKEDFQKNRKLSENNRQDAEEDEMASDEKLLSTYQAIDDFHRTYSKRPLLSDYDYAQ
jgi:hypothetical protein